MNDKAEKIYGDAFFSLCREQNPEGLKDILGELTELDKIFSENTGFIRRKRVSIFCRSADTRFTGRKEPDFYMSIVK